MSVIIGVDLGTTSTKSIAFDLQGSVLADAYAEYPILTPQPTYAEQNPEVVLAAVVTTLKKVIQKVGADNIRGVSFSSAMHSLIALDAQHNLLTNCIIWADNRSQPEADTLKNSELGLDIYKHTGTPIHPMSPLCKLLWLQKNEPAIFSRAEKFISIKEYIFYQFFGKFLIDYSLASATGLFNIRTFSWYAPALELTKINFSKLSLPVNPLHSETTLLPEYAAIFGLKNTPFIIGASDGCLANLGTGATSPGIAALTIGTSGAVRVTTSKPAEDVTQRLFSYILSPTHYVVGGPVNNGGVILRWFRDNFGLPEKAEANLSGENAYDILLAQAENIKPGADGLLFLPYLLGERAPIWDAQARGVYFGLSLTHTKAHLLRAVLEGILFGIYQVANALEETTGPIAVIYASGGFARSEFWLQMLADIFNKKVVLSQTIESSAWGAALLGMQALNISPVPSINSLSTNIEYIPIPENHAQYVQNFSIFETLYPLLKEQMGKISVLQKG